MNLQLHRCNSSRRNYVSLAQLFLVVLAFGALSPVVAYPQDSKAQDSRSDVKQRNKAVVELYFHQILDGRRFELVREIYAENATIQFPGKPQIKGREMMERTVREALSKADSFHTTITDIVAEGDVVIARIEHDAKYSEGFNWQNRPGVEPSSLPVRQARWEAMTLFRFKEGKIVEQLICRDELAVLVENGTVTVSPKR